MGPLGDSALSGKTPAPNGKARLSGASFPSQKEKLGTVLHYDHYCHRHRPVVLCSTTSDSERLALSSITRLADTNPCFGCQQGRLLLLRAGRCLQSSTGQAAVHPQRCRPTRVLSQALRTHQPASPRPSLVASPGTDSVLSLCSGIPMSQRISTAISH